ncbi:MAG TPA: serine protease [Candidatus Methylacidiphilales bacterium]|jgi:V8-like Glu-specific endopeptidase|nr:serine protease [Candidatus Methylacidiphilales bacterium]
MTARCYFFAVSRLFSLLLMALAAGLARGDGDATVVQKFEGNSGNTATATFTVQDKWELLWFIGPPASITVLTADGQVVTGVHSTFNGSVYVPKGGTYYVQITRDHTEIAAPWKFVVTQVGSGTQLTGVDQSITNPGTPPYTPPATILSPGAVAPSTAGPGAAGASTAASFGAPPSVWRSMPPSAPSAPQPAVTPPPAPAAATTTPAAVAASANLTQDQARAVVLIKGDNGEGTGFLVKTMHGPVVITNQHVIANNPNVKITTSNGVTIDVLSAKAATDRDLAMIAIKDAGYSYLTFATDVTAVSPGDPVVTPGNSEGGEVMLNTNGKVLALGPDRIEIDNPIYHGNSGGPVYDSKTNQVIGVVTEALKVDTSDELDKASFTSRNSAIQGSMRYFALRLDNVPTWEDIDWRSFQSETAFLDKFNQRSRCLDSFLNAPTGSQGQPQTEQDKENANLWREDTALTRANEQFEDQSGGNVDTGQQMDALRELLGSIVDAASTDISTIQNTNNFYSYDRQRAKEEMEYRQAIKDELDRISTNVSRLGSLPRTNN